MLSLVVSLLVVYCSCPSLLRMCPAFPQKATSVARATQIGPSITQHHAISKMTLVGSRWVKKSVLKFLKPCITYSTPYVHRTFCLFKTLHQYNGLSASLLERRVSYFSILSNRCDSSQFVADSGTKYSRAPSVLKSTTTDSLFKPSLFSLQSCLKALRGAAPHGPFLTPWVCKYCKSR
jgi:hypothetical protein